MKEKNRGMTLVELLAAIAILAIITGPFLNAFVTSARMNSKARHTLRATTVAQNLMEAMTAFSLEELCVQFYETPAERFLLTSAQDGYKELKIKENEGKPNSVTIADVTEGDTTLRKLKFVGQDSKKYYFAIQGIEEDGVKYDALISIDAAKYRRAPGDTDPDAGKHAYNENEQFRVEAMNSLTDVVWVQDFQSDGAAHAKIFNEVKAQSGSDTMETIVRETVRTLEVEIAAEDGRQKVTICPRYEYTPQNGRAAIVVQDTMTQYTQYIDALRNLYLMYYPNYNSMAGNCRDIIHIITTEEEDCHLYIIKQRTSETNLIVNEKNYQMQLWVTDAAYTGAADYLSCFDLRSNLGRVLTSPIGEKAENQLSYRYDRNGAGGTEDQSAIQKMLGIPEEGIPSLAGSTPFDNLIYETTVEIFPEGTYASGDYNEDKRLAVLSNCQ